MKTRQGAEIPEELLASATELAAMSTVSREEIQMLFQGERRNNPTGNRAVWSNEARTARKMMAEEM